MGVLEDYQGQGIATKLFNKAFEWAKEVGILRLGLTVMKGNDKAFNLYRKMGFVLEGERVQSLRVNGEDRKSTRLNSSHRLTSRMPSSA